MRVHQNQKGGFSWYLVLAKRGQEKLAADNLQRQGFDTYLPMYAPTPTKRAGKVIEVTPRPFLPGYLFVSVDVTAGRWRAINSTIGVRALYMTGSGEGMRPRALPNSWIEQLQVREVNGLIVRPHQDEVRAAFASGSAVSFSVGHADLAAVFLEPIDAKRSVILVSLFGRDSRQEVETSALRSRDH